VGSSQPRFPLPLKKAFVIEMILYRVTLSDATRHSYYTILKLFATQKPAKGVNNFLCIGVVTFVYADFLCGYEYTNILTSLLKL
jgi:hypothetical protein